MTKNERLVLEVLREPSPLSGSPPPIWWTPSQIGRRCGKIQARASSWACCYLCKLRDRGLVRRESPGVYAITAAGLAALEEK